jgi:hypothetical protein
MREAAYGQHPEASTEAWRDGSSASPDASPQWMKKTCCMGSALLFVTVGVAMHEFLQTETLPQHTT